jgi:hypothetical protein
VNLRLGESIIIDGPRPAIAAAHRTFSAGDKVKLTDQNGSEVWFRVSDVTDDENLILERCPAVQTPTPLSPFGSSSITISADFQDQKTGFQVKPKEFVSVTDSRGRKTKLQVDVIVGKDFVVLGLPGKTASSFFNKLRLLWHIGRS